MCVRGYHHLLIYLLDVAGEAAAPQLRDHRLPYYYYCIIIVGVVAPSPVHAG